MSSLTKKRIENVFKGSMKSLEKTGKPAVSENMKLQGYSEASSTSQSITQTKTWSKLKEKYLKDELALKTFKELAHKKNEDKDNRLKASIEIMKLNDRYPAQKSKVLGLFGGLEELEN